MFSPSWQNDLRQQAAQQAAMRRAIAAQRELEALKVASLNAMHRPAAPPSIEALTGQAQSVPGPMPEEVRAQLDCNRGKWGPWLASVHSEYVRAHWWAEWLVESPIGQEVAAEIKAREDARVAAEAAERERREQRAMDERLQRELQERWRLPEGTVVRIMAPRSKLDGSFGKVRSMEWQGHKLWAQVLVDPLPPGHPMQERPTRYRPLHLMPMVESFAAEMLRREHPEALG